MRPGEMGALIEAHLRAEGNGHPEGTVANYTADIEHDVVGFPGSPCGGGRSQRDAYSATENREQHVSADNCRPDK